MEELEAETDRLRNEMDRRMPELKDAEQQVQLLQDDVADLDQIALTEKAEAEKNLARKQTMIDLLEMELKKQSKGDDEGGASNGNDDDGNYSQWQRLNADLRTLDDENAQLQKGI